MKSLITIVIPCYNEEAVLPLFMDAISPVREALALGTYDNDPVVTFSACETELLFIDDGSTDKTLELLRTFNADDPTVRYLSFSRHFGKEAGIYAGLKEARGDYVVLIDADLQHPVEFIPEMYRILSCPTSGEADDENTPDIRYDSVAMYRRSRKGEKRIRSFFSKCFYRMINRISKIDLIDGATDYRMMTRQMVDAILELKEYNRFTKGLFNWVGFSTFWMPYDNVERKAGSTKW